MHPRASTVSPAALAGSGVPTTDLRGRECPVVFPGEPGDFYAPEPPAPDAR